MIVFDASTVVGAALKRDSVPEQALLLAGERDTFALSRSVSAEITAVLNRPKFAQAISRERRLRILEILHREAVWFDSTSCVKECRDPGDDQYLELALASEADLIVSSDQDLLALDPWRGVRILRPAAYIALP